MPASVSVAPLSVWKGGDDLSGHRHLVVELSWEAGQLHRSGVSQEHIAT
jgi:hypothetical protein